MLWKSHGLFLLTRISSYMYCKKWISFKTLNLLYFSLYVSVTAESRQTCCHNRTVLEKILTFGRELQNMSIQLRREHGKNETNKKALQVSQSQNVQFHMHVLHVLFVTDGRYIYCCSNSRAPAHQRIKFCNP